MYRFYIRDSDKKRLVEYPMKEVQFLCDQLGLDFKQDMRYRWFLEQALICLLPLGWKQEKDHSGKFQFHNLNTCATTDKHPLLFKFRKAFARLVYNDPECGMDIEMSEDMKTNIPKDIAVSSYDEQLKIFAELLQKSKTEDLTSKEDKFKAVIKDAEEFYDALLGRINDTLPAQYENSVEYMLVDPEKMYDTAKRLGINKEYRLVWIARLADVLPLPPFWKKVTDQIGNDLYFNLELNKTINSHPARTSLLKLIRRLRDQRKGVYNKTIQFFDKECKSFELTMMNFIKGDLTRVYLSDVPDMNFQRRAKFYRPRITMEQALNDIMVLNIAKTIGIKLENEIHLITPLYSYLEKYRDTPESNMWEFRYTLEGKSYWYNNQLNKSNKVFPFKDEVKNYINTVRIETYSKVKKRVRMYLQRHAEFKAQGKGLFEEARGYAVKIMESFILKKIGYIDKPEEIDLRQYVEKLSIKPDYPQLLDQLFSCPFKFSTRRKPIIIELKLESDQDQSSYSYDVTDRPVLENSGSLSRYEDEGHLSNSEIYSNNNEHSIQVIPPEDFIDYRDNEEQLTPRGSDDIFKLSADYVKGLPPERSAIRRNTLSHFGLSAPMSEGIRRERRISSTCSLNIVHDSIIEDDPGEAEEYSLTESSSSEDKSQIDYEELDTLKYTEEVESSKSELQRSYTDIPQMMKYEIDNVEEYPKFMRNRSNKSKTGYDKSSSKVFSRRAVKFSSLPAKFHLDINSIQKLDRHLPPILENNELTSQRSIDSQNLQYNTEDQQITDLPTENTEDQTDQFTIPIYETSKEFELVESSSVHSVFSSARNTEGHNSRLNTSRSSIKEQPTLNISDYPCLIEPEPSPIEPKEEPSSSKNKPRSRDRSGTLPTQDLCLSIKRKGFTNRTVAGRDSKLDSETPTNNVLITTFDWDTSNIQSKNQPEPDKVIVTSDVGVSDKLSTEATNINEFEVKINNLIELSESKHNSDRELDDSMSKHEISDQHGYVMKSILDEYKSSIFSVGKKEISLNTSLEKYQNRDLGVFSSNLQTRTHKNLKQILNQKYSFKLTSPRATSEYITQDLPELKAYQLKFEKRERKKYFMYYLNILGHPFSPNKIISQQFLTYKIQPPQVMVMGKRLGLKVSPREFESSESDLLWIAHLQLVIPMPPEFKSPFINNKVFHWPLGTHPGDSYFEFMLKYHRVERTKQLENLDIHDQMTDLIYNSWLKFMDSRHKSYYYNFLTCYKSYLSPFDGSLCSVPQDYHTARLIELLSDEDKISKSYLKHMYKSSDKLYAETPSNLSKSQSLHYLMENTIPSKLANLRKKHISIKQDQMNENQQLPDSFSLPSISRAHMYSSFSTKKSQPSLSPINSDCPPHISITGVSPRNIRFGKNR